MKQDIAHSPFYVVKRDGGEVPFDAAKIGGALSRCYAAIGRPTPEGASASVVSVLAGKYGASVTVEQVQDAVETVLLSIGEREAAKAYMAYRDAHAERRRLAIVTPELRAAYEAGAAAMGNDPLRTFQFFDKYSRWNGERRETWPECVDRAVEHLRWLVIRECGADRFTEGEWLEIRDAIRACDALPSMRLLSQAGTAARRDDVSIFNCSFQVIDSLECFRESLLISMAGAGDAYSVESQFIRELPLVRHQRGLRADTHVVEDTSEGWADALMVGLTRWFDGADVVFDYSALRPAGAILRTKGGRASGPAPLRTVLRLARSLVLSRQGSQLRPVDVNDLLCATGEAGNSGGMRRTAKLSLSDWGDTEMQDAKGRPGWWDTHPYRENANNSAVWPDGGPSQLDLISQFQSMYTARSGERGIFSRENALRTMPAARAEYLRRSGGARRLGTNSCAEIYLQSESFCNLTQGVARPGDTVESLRRKVRLATRMGTIQSLATRYRYLRASWGEHGREERLLGVDVTGQMDCPILRDGCPDAVLRQLRAEARAQNAADAERLGIRPSMAITCNKPSGNSSAFLDAAPGINARKIRYGIRNARVSAASPIFRVLKACGVPMDPENGQQADTATKWVIHFPMAAPEGSVIESERSALQQLDHWLLNKRNWTEHNPSVTVTYSPDEMIGIIGWVWEHRTEVGGVSFLPRADTVYRQMPYEETTRAEYERALAAFPRIDWALIAAFEAEDMTTSSQELACGGGKCESV